MRARLPQSPFLYPIVDPAALAGRSVAAAVAALAEGGARIVQLRAKQASDRELLALAREALSAARAAGALLIVNDRPDVARIVGADGVHVGQEDLPPAEARRVLGEHAIVGVSTHDTAQLDQALRAPLDYVAVGPVFETRSKQRPDPVVGLDLVRRARALTRLPVVAIGGITRERAREVVEAGADAVAVISGLLSATDLAAAARAFVAALRGEA